jgi:phospholipid/cholesterol/gamma-HCH transport system substrate-binding protein
METDRRYFIEGLFIIGFAVAAALFFVWLANAGHRDDVLYRIVFRESVSGLSVGDPVAYNGVAVGKVESMALDPKDPQRVEVEVRLRKTAPVTTDTKATLALKGITGGRFIELEGGNSGAPTLASATPAGEIPVIPSERSGLASIREALPQVVAKLSTLEDRTDRVMGDAEGLVRELKQNPSELVWGRSKHNQPPPALAKLSALEDRADDVLTETEGLVQELKENPSQLVWGRSKRNEPPEAIARLSAVEERANKLMTEVEGLVRELKANPSQLVWGRSKRGETPEVIAKLSALEDRTNRVAGDAEALVQQLKQNPSQLIWGRRQRSGAGSNQNALGGRHGPDKG